MNKRKVGSGKERIAAEYLKDHGYRILEMNYYCKAGEIDIIALDGDAVIFVEVKYRTSENCGDPLSAVDRAKQRQITRTARDYLWRSGYGAETDCRFDVIGITGGRITHIENAFDAVF